MQADEIISKAELFAMDFIAKIQDKNMQEAAKAAYFMDNQEELGKMLQGLKTVVERLKEQDIITDDDYVLVDRAEALRTQIEDCIKIYQQSLNIKSDVSEEETSAQLTEQTIAEAMKTNQTTQQISKNMAEIAEQQKLAANAPAFNYALVCDGQINMIQANDKSTLNNMINQVAGNGNYKNISLFQMSFKPVPLKQKTILSV